MKTAIVTGANGFIGAAVVRELAAHGYEVFAIGHQEHFERLHNVAHVYCLSCDLSEIARLPHRLPAKQYDLFFHFAWAGVSGTLQHDSRIQLNNIQGTVDALNIAKKLGCRRFIGAGSIMEWESMEAVRFEPSLLRNSNIYGGSKLAAHIISLSEAKTMGMDFLWPIITNVYGPGEVSSRLINTTIRKCLQGISPQFTSGDQNYDFVYIDDAARAFRMVGEKGKPFHNYIIGSSEAKPLKKFLLEMQKVIAPDLPFLFGRMPFRGIDLPIEVFDCQQTEEDTGFRAIVPFAEGCRRTACWWRKYLEIHALLREK